MRNNYDCSRSYVAPFSYIPLPGRDDIADPAGKPDTSRHRATRLGNTSVRYKIGLFKEGAQIHTAQPCYRLSCVVLETGRMDR